jgi:hypothetical protein
MVEPLRHRQTKGAATDMPGLLPPRHIPTLPIVIVTSEKGVIVFPVRELVETFQDKILSPIGHPS